MGTGRSLTLFALLAVGSVAAAVSRSRDEGNPFLGAWQLSALEEMGPDGQLHTAKCAGLLTFTPDSHMAVQVMNADSTGAASAYSEKGYEASFGTYDVDRRSGRFIYHVEGALVRSLIGQRQERSYAFNGKSLVITPANPTEHWRVTWTR